MRIPTPPAVAMQRLMAGNARFVRGESSYRPPRPEELAKLADAQFPFATILGCSDSRVPPEMVFDQGLGDVFVVRVAGNVVSPEVFGSLGYALLHLRTSLFVVLGHQGCGAVGAALNLVRRGQAEPGSIGDLVETIRPALEAIAAAAPPAEQMRLAVTANVRWAMKCMAATPGGAAALAADEIQLVGAVYETTTGRVDWLEDAG